MNRSALVAGIVTVSLAYPGVAAAGTVTVVGTNPFATFQAGGGEVNNLTIDSHFTQAALRDAGATLLPKKGCSLLPDGRATCDGIRTVEARLGDQDDRAHAFIAGKSRLYGGSGNDDLYANAYGTSGEAYGESGDDTITAFGEGGQIADGGSGDDTVHGGGWEGQATAIGGTGDDVIDMYTAMGALATIQGGTGDDIVTTPVLRYASTIDGGTGDDILVIDGPDRQFGPNPSNNSFTITAGEGNDSIVAGPKDDTVDAGTGRDFVDVKNGGSDTVACGDGIDVVRADAADTIAGDCEVRTS